MEDFKRFIILKSNSAIRINMDELKFYVFNDENHIPLLKYFKGQHKTYELFNNRILEPILIRLINIVNVETPDVDHGNIIEEFKTFCSQVEEIYADITPYSYSEAFAIESESLRSLVFGTINVGEMVKNLGHVLHKVDGIELTQKKYSDSGEYIGDYLLTNVYEVHKVDGTKLHNAVGDFYAVKCWCTTTNNEHWIWIEEEYKDDPLSAIASTFRFHKSVIPKIKALKRQGDIMIVEMLEDVKIPENEEIVPLTKDQYFSLLVAQS